MIYMALHYVVQGHRFDIVEDFGCRASVYVSLASAFIIWVPPLIFSFGSFVISAMAFRNFWLRRITFSRHLQNSNSSLTPSRYFRLMSMAIVQMFWGLIVTSFSMWFTMHRGLRPWIGWEDVHYNFSRIAVFPAKSIPREQLIYTFLLWWTIPISTVLFCIFFAFGHDAMQEYRACFSWIRTTVFRSKSSEAPLKSLASSKFAQRSSPIVKWPPAQSSFTSSYPSTATSSITQFTTYEPSQGQFKISVPNATFAPSPERTRNSRFSNASSMHKSVTTIFTETDETYSDLKPYNLKYPKAIGSYSDLSIVDSASPLSPSTTVASLSAADIEKGRPAFPASPPAPLSPPPPNPRRLKPLFLANQDRGRDAFANGMRCPTSPRPLSYPSYSPPHLSVNPPLPTPSRPPMPLSNQ